jgi:citrate synthase
MILAAPLIMTKVVATEWQLSECNNDNTELCYKGLRTQKVEENCRREFRKD